MMMTPFISVFRGSQSEISDFEKTSCQKRAHLANPLSILKKVDGTCTITSRPASIQNSPAGLNHILKVEAIIIRDLETPELVTRGHAPS